jgi:L-lactate dehydrogenase complex protein LldF
VCPVKIELHKLLLYNRRDSVEADLSSKSEKWTYVFWKKAMLKRETMNKGGASTKNFILQNFFRKSWGDRRDLPKVADKSFNEIMRERMGMR